MKIGIIGISRKNMALPGGIFNTIYSACGRNTGNYMFTEAVYRCIAGQMSHVGFGFDPDFVNSEYNMLVVPAANWLNNHSDWTWLCDRLAQIEIPVVTVGIGVQAHSSDISAVKVTDTAHRLATILSQKSQYISTRGEFTSRWLRSIGVSNVVTTGCPSLYMAQKTSDPVEIHGRVALQSTRYGMAEAFLQRDDMNRNLFLLSGRLGLDMVYQSEIEEIDYLLHGDNANALTRPGAAFLAKCYGFGNLEETKKYLDQHGHTFFDLDSWSNYIRSTCGLIGTRLHGNIMALNSGVPSILIAHDSRTSELIEFAQIPTFKGGGELCDMSEVDLRGLLENVDVSKFFDARRRNGLIFRQFLQDCGLQVRDEGFADQ